MNTPTKEIPTGKRNIKLDLRTWNVLKNLKNITKIEKHG